MQAEATTTKPMFTFNPGTPRDTAIGHVDALLATVRGLLADVGVDGDDENRSKTWAAYYLTEMAETITESLA